MSPSAPLQDSTPANANSLRGSEFRRLIGG